MVAKVGTTKVNAGATGTTAPVTSVGSTAGNTLVMGLAVYSAANAAFTVTGISDTHNTWQFSTATSNQNPPVGQSWDGSVQGLSCIGCAIATAQAASTVTPTFSKSLDYADATVYEFSGIPSGSAIVAAAASSTGVTAATSVTTPSVTVPSGAYVAVATATNDGAVITSVSSGWTLDGADASVAYRINPPAGSLSCTFTGASQNWLSSAIIVIGPSGTSRSASASLTVTPSFTAAAAQRQSASLTVTPSFSATGAKGAPTRTASASLTVTPSFSAAAAPTRRRPASLTVAPSFSASPHAAHVASASLTVTPSFSAPPHAAHVRTASLTVTPVLSASASKAGGAPPGYPDGDLGAMVELLLGTGWTDITDRALPDGQQFGQVRSGQPDGAQQPNPGQMNAVWDNPDYSLSPRNSSGPYYGQLRQNIPARVSVISPYGGYLRLEADNADQASTPDTAALHVTGSLELRLEAVLSDYRACILAARNGGTTSSWAWSLNSNGTLEFQWRDSGGTLRTVISDAAVAVSWTAYRMTLDATTGTVTFYVSGSVDGPWTQLGSALSGTSGAATAVRAGDSPLTVGWNALTGTQLRGRVTAFRMYDGIASAGAGSGGGLADEAGVGLLLESGDALAAEAPDAGGTAVADASFSTQVPGTTSFTDAAGLAWSLSGGAEITSRDYLMHAELASLAPTSHSSGGMPRLNAQLAGRMRRLQQASAPAAESAIRRAILAQTGDLFPVSYWPMEDGFISRTFGPAAGSQLLTAFSGKIQPAADTSFEASAALPVLNGDQVSATVDSYTGGTGWAVRFLWKRGTTNPASGSVRLMEITTTGAAATIDVLVNADGTLNFAGKLSGGASAWTEAAEQVFNPPGTYGWWSVEAVPSGSDVQYSLVALAPGASTGNVDSHVVTGHGSFGNVTSILVNPDFALPDTVIGHLTVQKAVSSIFSLGQPLNAWRGELAADRFARVCAENGITARVIGRPSSSQAMGPQPRGSVWTILKDCVNTEQGLIFEPFGCFGLGFRTRESLGSQAAAVTLSFAAANLAGDLQPVDDDNGFLNDVTGSTADGTSWREVLDDGSAKSVSEPSAGGMGRYAGQVPYALNVADNSQLQAAVAFYLKRVSADEQRYRNVVMDCGVPGAPVKDIARLRPGDLITITGVPGIYQTADIKVLATGFTQVFGPGRRTVCDCVPWSPYGT